VIIILVFVEFVNQIYHKKTLQKFTAAQHQQTTANIMQSVNE